MTAITRRRLIQGTALAAGATVFGPWTHNRVFAAASDKPIKIGLTHDASGQFANSGQAEKRGTILAIEEANARGGVLGRKVEYVWMDTETTPQTGTRVINRAPDQPRERAFPGRRLTVERTIPSNAISQVAQKYGCIYFNISPRDWPPTPARPPNPARTATAPSSCGTAAARTSRGGRPRRTRSIPSASPGT